MAEWEYETKDKGGAILEFKDGATPRGTALFSRFNLIDADLDVTKESFLPRGARAPFLVAHQWGEIPLGSGTIRVTPTAAYYDFELTRSAKAKELAEWLRFDLASGDPKSEFSYGFHILDGGSSRGMFDGKSVRFLHGREDGSPGCRVSECSYVLRGSGVSTALIDMKGQRQYEFRLMHEKILAQIAETKAQDQAELQALFARFMARERELGRC